MTKDNKMTEIKNEPEEKGNFKGINMLTGRKIYMTPEEEAIVKKQGRPLRIGLWILVIILLIEFVSIIMGWLW